MTTDSADAEPTFDRVSSTLALYALSSRTEVDVVGYWAGYRPGPALPLTASISLEDAWRDVGGVYLFCARTFEHDAAFLAAVDAWLAVNSPARDVRYLWLADPDVPSAGSTAVVRARQVGGGRDVWWQVSSDVVVALGGYRLVVSAGSLVVQRAGTATGFWLQDALARLVAPDGSVFTVEPNSAWIPLTGTRLGAWQADLPVGAGGNPGLSTFAPQVRYTVADGRRTVAMPVLDSAVGAALAATLSFDPLYPGRPDRTAIALTGTTMPALASRLRTPRGRSVTLTPRATGSWPARLVFNVSPDAGDDGHYLTVDGTFVLGLPAVEPRLALGLSGMEYVEQPVGPAAICRFVAGQPAMAEVDGTLTDGATTAYVDLLAADADRPALRYFAQPEQAPWFAVDVADGEGFLPSQAFPAATLPGWPGASRTPFGLPMGCYTGVAETDFADAGWLEEAVIAPARRAVIAGGAPAGPAVHCVTPHGIAAHSWVAGAGWDELVVACFPRSDIQRMTFTDVSAILRGQLQASELFMVVADPRVLIDESSVRYRLDPVVLEQLRSAGVPQPVIDRIVENMPPDFPVFHDETQLREWVTPYAGDYLDIIVSIAGQLKVTMDGWTFQLSPRSWRTGGDAPTMMLIKGSRRSLADLAADPTAWTWPVAAGDIPATRARLIAILDAAAAAAPGSPSGRFHREVVMDARWSGVVFLNAPIVSAELPEEMRFVTAGIDPGRFYAEHVVFGPTPCIATTGAVEFGQTAASAFIRYGDDTELAPPTTVPFAFVTQHLEVGFAGGSVTGMSARVQLVVNELFGSRLTRLDPVGGNSLTIVGSYQRLGTTPGYRFGLDRPAVYQTASAALDSIEVLGVAVRTLRVPTDQASVTVEFGLEGNLRFTDLPTFDLFSYGPKPMPVDVRPEDGYLRFADLAVTMTFPVAAPANQTFTSDEARLRVDPPNSRHRRGSLVAGFPVSATGVIAVASGDVRPADLGYAPVLAPLDQVPLTAPWYGLTMRLDLGTLGRLGDAAGLTATLLAAWSPGARPGDRPVYCGLRLPGIDDSGWPVQGVLRLGFRGYEFMVDDTGPARAYLLRLSRLALSVLGWSFPPGRTDVVVFGDPSSTSAASVGWYGAYPQEN